MPALPGFQLTGLLDYNRAQREVHVRGVLVTAVICLAVGIGVLFAFCHGNTGFAFAYPISATSLHVDITTTGSPALLGCVLTVLGAFLLIVVTVIALVGMGRDHGSGGPIKRRESAFEE